MNTTTATPVQIDTEIARLFGEQSKAHAAAERANANIERIERIEGIEDYDRDLSWNSPEALAKSIAERDAAEAVIAETTEALSPLYAEFTARGGWNRYYLVDNSSGHVHSSTGCDTCFPTTQFAWLTQESGTTHAALVEKAGEQACTVCFPNAPVDTLRRKSTLTTPERAARAAEKAAKDAAKADAAVEVPGFTEYGRTGKTFKTLRGATNALSENLTSLLWYGEGHPTAAEWSTNADAIIAAVAAKTGRTVEDVAAEAHAKAAKSHARNAR